MMEQLFYMRWVREGYSNKMAFKEKQKEMGHVHVLEKNISGKGNNNCKALRWSVPDEFKEHQRGPCGRSGDGGRRGIGAAAVSLDG
jgi:hypothetical protein